MIIQKEFRGRVVFQRSKDSNIKCNCSACKRNGGDHVFSSYIDGDFRKEDFIRDLLKGFDSSYRNLEGKEIIMKVTIEEDKWRNHNE